MTDAAGRVSVTRLSTPADLRDELAADVRLGLTGGARQLPPKYFYDARGSALFEEITRLPEYYLTRAETEILEAHADELVGEARPQELLELGSGSSRKTRLLLEAMHAQGAGHRYVPVDVSETALRTAAEALVADYPWLRVDAYVGDFHTDLALIPPVGRRLVAFLGSTIGNLEPPERASFYKSVAGLVGDDGNLLLGVDLLKDPSVLEAAYDDAAGVTAEFNKNVLHVLARELAAEVPVDAFEHVAAFDREHSWVEMRLRATHAVVLRFPTLGLDVPFAAGDEVRTEISAKFTRPVVEEELAGAGLDVKRWLTDTGGRFALLLAVTG